MEKFELLAKECIDELMFVQEKFNQEYDLDSYTNWFYNQSTELLTFSSDENELNFHYLDLGSFSDKF